MTFELRIKVEWLWNDSWVTIEVINSWYFSTFKFDKIFSKTIYVAKAAIVSLHMQVLGHGSPMWMTQSELRNCRIRDKTYLFLIWKWRERNFSTPVEKRIYSFVVKRERDNEKIKIIKDNTNQKEKKLFLSEYKQLVC